MVIPRHRQQLAQHIMYTPRHQLIICLSHKVCWKLNKILRSTVQIKLGLSADVLRQTKCYCELLSLCRAVQLSGSVSAAQWQCYRLMFPRSLISQLCFVTRCSVCRGRLGTARMGTLSTKGTFNNYVSSYCLRSIPGDPDVVCEDDSIIGWHNDLMTWWHNDIMT